MEHTTALIVQRIDDIATAWKCLHAEVSRLLVERTQERDEARRQLREAMDELNTVRYNWKMAEGVANARAHVPFNHSTPKGV